MSCRTLRQRGRFIVSGDAAAEIAALEATRARAIVERDVRALRAMTAEDYVHVEASGALRDRAGFLSVLTSGAGRFVRYDLIENHIAVLGDAAMVTGIFENAFQAADGAVTPKRARHLRVYARLAGGWLNIAHQATALAAVEGGAATTGAGRAP